MVLQHFNLGVELRKENVFAAPPHVTYDVPPYFILVRLLSRAFTLLGTNIDHITHPAANATTA